VSQVTETDHELAKEVTKTPEKGEKFDFFSPAMPRRWIGRGAHPIDIFDVIGSKFVPPPNPPCPQEVWKPTHGEDGAKKRYQLMSHHFLIRLALAAPEIHEDSSTGPILHEECSVCLGNEYDYFP
jgi:hypothetical protein